ncbi:MAG: hypothetical protein ACYDCK_08175 [Thermoplasmatota archaeon]
MQGISRSSVSIGIVIALLAIGTGAYAYAKTQTRSSLDVSDAFFVERSHDARNATLEAVLYLTNGGSRAADEVHVIAYLVNDRTGLATASIASDALAIPSARTSDVHLTVTAEDLLAKNDSASYRVTFLVFESGHITLRGAGFLGNAPCCAYPDASGAAATDVKATVPSFERVG